MSNLKVLAALTLLPLCALLLVPVVTAATASEPTGVYVYISVGCGSYGRPASGASLHYAGITYPVLCTPGSIENENSHQVQNCVFITGQPKYTATVFAGGQHTTMKGTFGVNNRGQEVSGGIESYNGNSGAGFELEYVDSCVG